MPVATTETAALLPKSPVNGGNPVNDRVLIVDDCRIRREYLANVLADDGFGVAAAWDLDSFRTNMHDGFCVLLINLTSRDAKPILRLCCEAGMASRALVFGLDRGDENDIVALAEAGVTGYHMRSESLSELVDFIGGVARGESGCSSGVSTILLQRLSRTAAERMTKSTTAPLTTRETQILQMLELGLSNQEISTRLNIATHTVKNHVHKVLSKIGARSRSQAAALARNKSSQESSLLPNAIGAAAQIQSSHGIGPPD
jgi:DNA-binding NarL/FixJ family response regulator